MYGFMPCNIWAMRKRRRIVKEMHLKLQERSRVSVTAGLFFPATHAQLQFTNIAHTGMQQHLQYLDSTVDFHEDLRRYFYLKYLAIVSSG